MAISASARREVVELARQKAAERMLTSMGEWSVTDGPLREFVMNTIPRTTWQYTLYPDSSAAFEEYQRRTNPSKPVPLSLPYWEAYNISDDAVAALEQWGRVEEVPHQTLGRYHRIKPSPTPMTSLMEPDGFSRLRTAAEQQVWDAYWRAYGDAVSGPAGRLAESLALLGEAIAALRDEAALKASGRD